MKLAELLYQNRDKFTLHPDCKWIAQDGDKISPCLQYSSFPVIAGIYVYVSEFFIVSADEIQTNELPDDWMNPTSRKDYEKYCKEQDAKLVNDIDNALIKFKPFVSVEDNPALAEMPKPEGKGNPILGMVLADLTNRAFEGIKKYGEPLKADNGRDALVDAYQEALDLCMYLRQAIEERNNG